MSAGEALAAFQRLVDALNHARDAAPLRAAVIDEIVLARHAPGDRVAASVVERFTGIAEVAAWFARMPPAVEFSLAGAPWREADTEDPTWGIEYAYRAVEFHHGGMWIARLARDGRIAQLSHHPFALHESPGTPHAHGGSGHTHGA